MVKSELPAGEVGRGNAGKGSVSLKGHSRIKHDSPMANRAQSVEKCYNSPESAYALWGILFHLPPISVLAGSGTPARFLQKKWERKIIENSSE